MSFLIQLLLQALDFLAKSFHRQKSFHNTRDSLYLVVHEILTKHTSVCGIGMHVGECLNLNILVLIWIQNLFSKNRHSLDQTNPYSNLKEIEMEI